MAHATVPAAAAAAVAAHRLQQLVRVGTTNSSSSACRRTCDRAVRTRTADARVRASTWASRGVDISSSATASR